MPNAYDGRADEAPGGPITSAKLRRIAEWLDLGDTAFGVLADLRAEELPEGSAVQDDLRRWADEMDIDEADVLLDGAARICHEANRALQLIQADPSIPVSVPWDETSEEQRASVRQGVVAAMSGTNAAKSHHDWCEFKIDHGWSWGPVKDEATKQHPLLVPYEEMPESAKVKDRLFLAIVDAVMGAD